MSTPAAKRRRTDAISQTLSRPFRSPFKTPLNEKGSESSAGSNIHTPTRLRPRTQAPHAKPFVTPKTSAASSPVPRKPFVSSLAAARAVEASDPETQSLLKAQRALEREIAGLRTEVDTLGQALKIESSNSDDELRDLVRKWRTASRAAADVVWVDVKERVNQMGGPAAWHAMQRRKDEWRSSAFDEPISHGESRSSKDDDSVYAEYDIDAPTESHRAKNGSTNTEAAYKQGLDDSDEDAFTMDMMLQSLNIELDIIGFDKRAQRWSDD
ncbi:MAG: hypothetical protein M1815_003299 [Lichina confinis]|nr:MAG: hypothetical protein M1815_003299 [Lichina confinis]